MAHEQSCCYAICEGSYRSGRMLQVTMQFAQTQALGPFAHERSDVQFAQDLPMLVLMRSVGRQPAFNPERSPCHYEAEFFGFYGNDFGVSEKFSERAVAGRPGADD